MKYKENVCCQRFLKILRYNTQSTTVSFRGRYWQRTNICLLLFVGRKLPYFHTLNIPKQLAEKINTKNGNHSKQPARTNFDGLPGSRKTKAQRGVLAELVTFAVTLADGPKDAPSP